MSIPYDHDAESAVIGCCLFGSGDAVRWAVDWLTAGDFHVPSHAHIFAAVVELFRNGSRVDNVTVVDQMTRDGTIRETTRSELNAALSNTPAVSAITRYGEIVQRHSLARAGLRLTSDAVSGLQDPTKDPAVVVDRLRADLGSIDSPIALRDPGDVTLAQLRSEPLEHRSPWVMEGLMRRDWRATLVGVEGSGKSILLRALAVCAAYGTQPFTGVATKPCRSLLIDLENPKDHLQDWVDRIADTCEHMGRTSDDRMSIWHRPGGIDLRRRTDRGELGDVLRRRKPDVVCLGPLYKAYRRSSSESDEQVASEVQDVLDDLRTRHGFGLVLEHHAPKAQGGTRPLDPFGSSLWLRWGEIRMSLVPPSKDFPVMSLKLKPFSGSRVEHAWPDEIHRGRFRLDLPWVGKPGRLAAEEAI